MLTVIAVVVSLAVGFGAGRIKNATKLKAISAELESVEKHLQTFAEHIGANAVAEAKRVIAAVRAKL
jgi:uncharacterized membrane-anchored protein YhcB (DUF1043 family)